MTLVPTWISPEPGDSGPPLRLSGAVDTGPQLGLTWPSEYAPSGPILDLVTLVPTWASSGHGSTEWPAGWPHLDLVTLVPTWASSGHGSSAWPAVWPHLDLGSGVATLASPMLGDTGTDVGLTWTW